MPTFFEQEPIIVTITAGVADKPGPFYLDMRAMLHFDLIADWTGTITGAWKLEAGGGFKGLDRIAATPGKWIDVTARAVPPLVNPAGAPASMEAGVAFWSALWARYSLTGIGGSGILTLCPSGKR